MRAVDYLRSMSERALEGDGQALFFFAALYLAFVLTLSLVLQIRARGWPETTGELLEGRVRKWGGTEWVKSEQDYVLSVLYRYEVDGVEYVGKKMSSWVVVASHNARHVLDHQLRKVRFDDNNRLIVYYNPRNPAKSLLVKPGLLGLSITAIIGYLPGLLYVFLYHT